VVLVTAMEAMAMQHVHTPLPQNETFSSTAARVRAYYEAIPEASLIVPVVDTSWARRPTRLSSPALHSALRIALTATGSGLNENDQVEYARTLRAAEQKATSGAKNASPFTRAFATPRSFETATRHEMNRALAVRGWPQVPIVVGGRTSTFYFRDILQAGLDALANAQSVRFEDQSLLGAVAFDAEDDGTRVRHGTLDSDIYLSDVRDVQQLHGAAARVMVIQLHPDEAVVSWSGANYMFPVRANLVNALDGGGCWKSVGYFEHIPKAVEKTAAARLAVSDARNDVFQRCIAQSTRMLARASETGMLAPVACHGVVRLVPRSVGLVVDQLEERCFYSLMGSSCRFF